MGRRFRATEDRCNWSFSSQRLWRAKEDYHTWKTSRSSFAMPTRHATRFAAPLRSASRRRPPTLQSAHTRTTPRLDSSATFRTTRLLCNFSGTQRALTRSAPAERQVAVLDPRPRMHHPLQHALRNHQLRSQPRAALRHRRPTVHLHSEPSTLAGSRPP
jgi:hypothetical protein